MDNQEKTQTETLQTSDVTSLIAEFKSLPEELRTEEGKLVALENRSRELQTKMKFKESLIMKDIVNATIEDKPLYSNKEKRDTELAKRLNDSTEYAELFKEEVVNDDKIRLCKVEIDFMVRRFTKDKVLLNFFAAKGE